MIDAFLETKQRLASSPPPVVVAGLDPARPMILVTAHRRENHEAMPAIAQAVKAIAAFPERPQIIWPVHPSPQVEPVVRGALTGVPGIRLTSPLDYASDGRGRRGRPLRADRLRRTARRSPDLGQAGARDAA